MKQTLKQLQINPKDPNFITAATELKGKSKKKFGELALIIFLFVLGIVFIGLILSMIPTTIDNYITAKTIGEYIIIILSSLFIYSLLGILAYFTLGMAIYWFTEKPKWYLGLYYDRLVFQQYNDSTKKYVEKKVPISSVQKCIILKTEHVNFLMIKGVARESVHYTISVHLEYKINGETKYIHLLRPDGFKQLNEVLSFFQDEKQIPIYYIYAPGKMYHYEERDERELIKEIEPEPLIFNGRLEDFTEREFLRKVNHFKALEQSKEYLQKKD